MVRIRRGIVVIVVEGESAPVGRVQRGGRRPVTYRSILASLAKNKQKEGRKGREESKGRERKGRGKERERERERKKKSKYTY
jgi:hypothetical protein